MRKNWFFAATAAATLILVHRSPIYADTLLGTFRSTFFNTTLESRYPGTPNVPVLDARGNVLATVTPGFKHQLDINGAGRLNNGKLLMYANVGGGSNSRYSFSSSPYGIAADTCNLVPFRTIAVDPNVIPLGSLVQIDQTIGMRLPDGTVHDGIWVADDKGVAIRGYHVDIYVGDDTEENENVYRKALPRESVTVRLISRNRGCSEYSRTVTAPSGK